MSELLDLDLKDFLDDESLDFPLRVPKSFFQRIKLGDKKDPLLLQVLPTKHETKDVSGFNEDPLQEKEYFSAPGLIHKYHGRVLLLVTDVCAINCRFCFRRYLRERNFSLEQALSYIASDCSINEVILSGGDPLMLVCEKLEAILSQLDFIDHVRKIRIHSRVPIVMPERVDIKSLRAKKPIVLVVHCNHPNEINDEVVAKLKLLQKQGIVIFNQSVLLRNINNDPRILIALSERLFDAGVLPYYLHILDKVKGSAHFYVNIREAKKIYVEMQNRLPGYLVPRLVVEMQNRKKYV